MAENTLNENPEISEQELNAIIKYRHERLNELIASGNNPFEFVKFDKSHNSKQILSDSEKLEGKEVTLAGRILTRRLMGKASFCHILDGEGLIQLYIRSDDIEDYDGFK